MQDNLHFFVSPSHAIIPVIFTRSIKEAKLMSTTCDFNNVKTICVVGLSANEDRTAYRIAQYLQDQGFRVIPVNPRGESALGEQGYTSISEIPEHIKIDVADFFLRSEKVLPIVEEALQRGIKTIWLQMGVVSNEAAKLCTECGADIIMDKCIKVEHIKSQYK